MSESSAYTLPVSVFKGVYALFKGADTIRITPSAIGWSMNVLSTDKTYMTGITVPRSMFTSYIQGGEFSISVNDIALMSRLNDDVGMTLTDGKMKCRAGRATLSIPLYSDYSAPPKIPSLDPVFSATLSSDDLAECISSSDALKSPYIRFGYDVSKKILEVSCADSLDTRRYSVETNVDGGDYAAESTYSADTVSAFFKAVGRGPLTISYTTDYPMEIVADRGYVAKLMVAPRVGD